MAYNINKSLSAYLEQHKEPYSLKKSVAAVEVVKVRSTERVDINQAIKEIDESLERLTKDVKNGMEAISKLDNKLNKLP